LCAILAVAVGATLLTFLIQPGAHDAAALARCSARGWPRKLAPRRYRDTSSGITQGFQQEFEIDGTDPRMAVWVEVRRPLYAPVWRVAEIVEVEVDTEPD
jgi:hypothetical protein